MFDFKVICYGIFVLAIAISAFLYIKHKIKPPQTFAEYMHDVNKEFVKRGFASNYTANMGERRWREYFNTGLSPKDSVDEYLM